MEQLTAINSQRMAIVTGLSLFVMAIAAFFAVGNLNQIGLELEAAKPTLNDGAFRISFVAWLIILITDIIVAWALYQLLKFTDQKMSLLMAFLRGVYAVFLGVALAVMVKFAFVDGSSLNKEMAMELSHSIEKFHKIWSLGLIIFGLHLLILGYLCLKTVFVPQLISLLIVIAGIGYLIVHIGHLLVPNFEVYQPTIEMVFILPMIFGELGLAFWLLIKRKKLV